LLGHSYSSWPIFPRPTRSPQTFIKTLDAWTAQY
jgi:hypothetical protein